MDAFTFHGSRYELLQIIKRLDGVMTDDCHFHCIQHLHPHHRRSGIAFRFGCTIRAEKADFIIVYRVRPTVITLLLPLTLLLLAVICIEAAFCGENWLFAVLSSAISAISILVLSALQKVCVKRFVKTFQKQTVNKKRYR
jgi:hypothetical protein